jgi:hypothetical protein
MAQPIKSTALANEAVASNPIPGTPNYWTRSSDGHPIFSDASSVDHDLEMATVTLPLPAGEIVADFFVETIDQFGRTQINHRPPGTPPNVEGAPFAGVVRLGMAQADGDPTNIVHEGIVDYGVNPEGVPMDPANWGLSRVKSTVFRLQSGTSNGARPGDNGTWWRVDGSAQFYISIDGTQIMHVDRTTKIAQFFGLQNTDPAKETVVVGPAGGAAPPPATPAKYLTVLDSAGMPFKIPLYNP